MSLVGGSVAGAAAVAAASRVAAGSTTASAANKTPDRWVVAEIGQVALGAIPVMLRNEMSGEQLNIEVCSRGARANAVASSARFDLFVANGGSGNVRTSPDHVVVARALGRKLDREVREVPAGVLTMSDRQSKHRELYETCDDIANA